jgi:tungstate transport system substrate-binding protein
MRIKLTAVLVLIGVLGFLFLRLARPDSHNQVVRCAVIGGMTMTGLWPEIVKRFEADTGYHCELVATGPRPEIAEPFRAGKADLLTMHSGDITTDLVADGFGINMRPWTRNELSIVGPTTDPAHIRGMTNGAAALRKIAEVKARFVDFQGVGSRELAHNLWRLSGVEPKGEWVVKDDTVSKFDVLQFARSNNAYVIVGYIPARLGKMNPEGVSGRLHKVTNRVCRHGYIPENISTPRNVKGQRREKLIISCDLSGSYCGRIVT